MTAQSGRYGQLSYREFIEIEEGEDEDDTPYTFVTIYDWKLTWGTNTKQHFWSLGNNFSHSLNGVMRGQLTCTLRGCEVDVVLMKPAIDALEIKLRTNVSEIYKLYVSPVQFQFHWNYSTVNGPTQFCEAVFDLVWYAPFFDLEGFEAEETICEFPKGCTLGLELDDVNVESRVSANLLIRREPYEVYFMRSPVKDKILIGPQPTSGPWSAELQIRVNDDGHGYVNGEVRKVEIFTTTVKKWELKWMRFSHRSDLVVSPRTSEIKVATLHSTLHKWRSDLRITTGQPPNEQELIPESGYIQLPNEEFL
jgi:hypothetical protein